MSATARSASPRYVGPRTLRGGARAAIADAGLTVGDIDGLITAYTMTEPYPVFYGALAEAMGMNLRYGVEQTAGGGTSGVMIHDAALAVISGR